MVEESYQLRDFGHRRYRLRWSMGSERSKAPGVLRSSVSCAMRRDRQKSDARSWPDLLDAGSVRKVVTISAPNAVLHVAWDVSHGNFIKQPSILIGFAASIQLARVAADAGVSRMSVWERASNMRRKKRLRRADNPGATDDPVRHFEGCGQAGDRWLCIQLDFHLRGRGCFICMAHSRTNAGSYRPFACGLLRGPG